MKKKLVLLLGCLIFGICSNLTAGLYDTYTIHDVGGYCEAVAVGDINSDSRNDVVAVTSLLFGETNGLYVFTQNESGALNDATIYTDPSSPFSVAIGDLNSDLKNDVAVSYPSLNSVAVYIQNVAGTLDAPVFYSVGSWPNSIKIADVNDDGMNDVIASNASSDYISILKQNVGGTLDVQETHAINASLIAKIDVADMNNDGLNDIVLMKCKSAGTDNIAVFLQGSFDTPSYYNTSITDTRVFGMGIGSVDSDSRSDIIASCGSGTIAYIAVFNQSVLGSIDSPVYYTASNSPSAVAIGDLTGDGRNDIALLHNEQSMISFYRQSSSGTIATHEYCYYPYSSDFGPHSIALGDINNDSICEVVVADRNNGLVIFNQAYSFSFLSHPSSVQPNQASDVFQVQLLNAVAGRVEAFSDTITLSSNSSTGKFSLSAATWSDTTIFVMTNGIVSFYYKDTALGYHTIRVSRNNYISASTLILVEIPGRIIPRNNFFNPAKGEKTTIFYDIPEDCGVTIRVYNLVGELVRVLVDEYKSAGQGYSIDWKGDNSQGISVASGVYYIHINAGSFKTTVKALVIK